MTKIFYLLLICFPALCLNSCSDDDNDEQNDKNILNPPNWIVGTWQSVEYGDIYKCEFTSDNYLLIASNNVFDFVDFSKQPYYTVKEVINNTTTYQVNKTFDAGTGQKLVEDYIFEKISDTRLTFSMPLGVGALVLEMKKVD